MRRRRWLIPVAAMLCLGAAGAAGNPAVPRAYEATLTMLVAPPLDSPFMSADALGAGRRATRIYLDVATQQRVLQPVADAVAPDRSWRELQRGMRASVEGRSEQLLVVRVRASSPQQAVAIADELGNQLVQLVAPAAAARLQADGRDFLWTRMRELFSRMRSVAVHDREATSASSRWQQSYASLLRFFAAHGPPNRLTVLEPAGGTARLVSPDVRLTTAAAAGAGLVLGALVVVALELRRDPTSRLERRTVAGSVRLGHG
jgi:capsular polysaccharide biosynthesis protein